MKGIIYAAFDTSNGKFYVGQTWVGFKRRIGQHIRSARNPKYLFQYALRSHSRDFVWSILAEVDTQEQLDEAEKSFVRELNSQAPNGYNLSEGGLGGRKTESTKQKLRVAHRGKVLTQEHRNRIGDAARGKLHSDEWRANISRGLSGKCSTTRSESMKRVWERRRSAS